MIILYVVALLYKGDEILLVRRTHARFGNGSYSFVGGKVEENERALHAIKREVFEETGLEIPEESFTLVHTFHRMGTEGPMMALCFKTDISKLSQPINMEPEKHDDMSFFPLRNFPKNILPAHKQAVECIEKNVSYSEHGW